MKKESNSLRGNEIEFNGIEMVYADTKKPTIENWKTRPCGHCGLGFTKEGHDGCLGELDPKKVMNACCGHGIESDAYLQNWEGEVIRGKRAINKIEAIKNSVLE